MILPVGVLCFGVVVGYITYRTLVRSKAKAEVRDLVVVVGAIGGGTVTALVEPGTDLFGWYGIGLLAGLVVYAVLFGVLNGRKKLGQRMSGEDIGAE